MRLLLVDHNILIRDGIRCLLEENDDMEVVAEVDSREEAVKKAVELQPDAVIIEAGLPEPDGLEAARQIKAQAPRVRIVALSQQPGGQWVRQMLDAGAAACLPKACEHDELRRALRAVVQGKAWISPELAQHVVRGGDNNGANGNPVFDRLTGREREVLQLLGDGLSSRSIAARLHISSKTVDTHRQHIMRKLAAPSVADLIKHAIRAGLTVAEPAMIRKG